jgi:hypothetical protein
MKFGDWVSSQGWSWREAANRLGLPNGAVAWRYTRGTIPRPAAMQRIWLISGGRVTPNDFYILPALPESAAHDSRDSRDAA